MIVEKRARDVRTHDLIRPIGDPGFPEFLRVVSHKQRGEDVLIDVDCSTPTVPMVVSLPAMDGDDVVEVER